MRPEDQLRLRHMLDAAQLATEFARLHDRRDLVSEALETHGVVRLLEVVGEAAARVSPECRAEIPAIPWSAVVSMRNRLIHGYFDLDLDVVWATLVDDLPPLIAILQESLRDAS
jgi:uncharacterized protein with HEPN domain